MTTAYDYDRQRWITGPQAAELLRQQARDTLAVLEGPSGAEYLHFIGDRRSLAEAVASAREAAR